MVAPGRDIARASAVPAAVTLGVALACWVLAIRQMSGMDTGVATGLGSFGFFISAWVAMMAAMMLPGTVPAVARRAAAAGNAGTVRLMLLFVGPYLAVWALAGIVAYAVYRPHGTAVAGAIVIAAGVYELTPVKRGFRLMCQATMRSGLMLGLCCLGSSIGLMLVLLALGAMSVLWMAVIAILVTAQKLLPPRAAIDVPLALAIITIGTLVTTGQVY